MKAWNRALARAPRKWVLVAKVLPIAAALVGLKFLIDLADGDFITLTSLFGSIVAANVFLLGFLLAGTLADYKESEKLPGDLASSIESIADEFVITVKNKGAAEAVEGLAFMLAFAASIRQWFYREERTRAVMGRIRGMNDLFLGLEPLTQPNFIVRMKQEQTNIRRMITRIDAIRDTAFVAPAYAMAELATALLIAGMLFMDIGGLGEEVFYMGIPSFLMIYLLLLIDDLDNPFNYSAGDLEAADVSIKPVLDVEERLREALAEAQGSGDGGDSVTEVREAMG